MADYQRQTEAGGAAGARGAAAARDDASAGAQTQSRLQRLANGSAQAAQLSARAAMMASAPVLQPVWANAEGTALNQEAGGKILADPLQALAEVSEQLGMGANAKVLAERFQLATTSGNTELIAEVRQALLNAWQAPGAVGIPFLLDQALKHLRLPEDEMSDGEHEEDAGGGNAEEELQEGDLLLHEIPSAQYETLGVALVSRKPELFRQFQERAAASRVQPSWDLFLTWFNEGVLTRSQFASLGTPIQKARTPHSLSFQAGYPSTSHGQFTNVTYKLDHLGSIAFNLPHKKGTWQNPVKPGSEVQLRTGSAKSKYGITLNGTKIVIPGASRGQHFSMANRIMNNGWGSSSPDGWTWHHLTAAYKMVLVDRKVHAKHGHNGGVYVWT